MKFQLIIKYGAQKDAQRGCVFVWPGASFVRSARNALQPPHGARYGCSLPRPLAAATRPPVGPPRRARRPGASFRWLAHVRERGRRPRSHATVPSAPTVADVANPRRPSRPRRPTGGALADDGVPVVLHQDLGTPAARKEQSPRVLCAYRMAMRARGASGRLPAQNDSVDTF